jgi:transposase
LFAIGTNETYLAHEWVSSPAGNTDMRQRLSLGPSSAMLAMHARGVRRKSTERRSPAIAGFADGSFKAQVGPSGTPGQGDTVLLGDQAQRFVVLPKRWLVERTFAWLGRCRRLAKDWECLNRKALAFFKLASIRLML